MRKLSVAELSQLESIVEDGVRYMIIRTGEDCEQIFRLRMPSHEQGMMASFISQAFLWELRKKPGLKSKEEVEQEFPEMFESLRKRNTILYEQLKEERIKMVEEFPTLTEGEEDKEQFLVELDERSVRTREIEAEWMEVTQQLAELYMGSIDHLVDQRRMAVITALCWEENVDGNWKPVWDSWPLFKDDRTPLARRLEQETTLFIGGSDFFDNLPSLLSGGSDM